MKKEPMLKRTNRTGKNKTLLAIIVAVSMLYVFFAPGISIAASNYNTYMYSTGTHYVSNCGYGETDAHGQTAGDQTGNEYKIGVWAATLSNNGNPWIAVFRYPDKRVGEKLAQLGIDAANNDHIGYDQDDRHTYWEELKKVGYDPSAITTDCEADCSSAVCTNVRAAGYLLNIGSLKNISLANTGNLTSVLTGAGFEVLTDSKYLTKKDYLLPGDILLATGHTLMNLTKGANANWGKKLTYQVQSEGSVSGKENGSFIEAGEQVSLTAVPAQGYLFSKWTVSGVPGLTESSSSTLTFTMPDNEVSLTVVFFRNPGATVWKYQNLKVVSATKTDAKLSGSLYYGKSVTQVLADINPTFWLIAGLNKNQVTEANPETYTGAHVIYIGKAVPTINGLDYTFPLSVNSIVTGEISGGSNWLSAGQTFYYKWFASQEGAVMQSPVMSGSTLGGVKWGTPDTAVVNNERRLYAYAYYDKSKITLSEVGIMISTNRTAVENVTYGNVPNTVENLKDTANINYNYDYDGTYVFYRQSSFNVVAFNPGTTYYYKFYSKDSAGEVQYSTISSYTPQNSTSNKYSLTLKAGSGGTITTGTSGSYAANSVLTLVATPSSGYIFTGWQKTAGTLSSETSASTQFTMPASAATVTANFEPRHYGLNISSTNEGGDVFSEKCPTYAFGAQVKLWAVARTGYRFAGWRSDNGGTFQSTYNSTTFTMPAGEVNINADFAMIDYTINTRVNGNGQILCDQSMAHMGENIALSAVPGEGYIFAGWSSSEVKIADQTAAETTITMGAGDATVTASFIQATGAASGEWQTAYAIPDHLNPSLLDIEYNNTYITESEVSPGDDWTKGALLRYNYVNSGDEYTSDFLLDALPSSKELVRYYYYHYCTTVKNDQSVSFKQTSQYTHYDEQPNRTYLYEVSSHTDSTDDRYTVYALKWTNDSWLACKGGETCQNSTHDYGSHYWYKRYVYQDKEKQPVNRWIRNSGWVSQIDENAFSYTVRWKIKDGLEADLVLPENLTVIESEAFSGIKDVIIRLPSGVSFIDESAFDPSVTILCTSGSYAEHRCSELGLTVLSE